MVARMQTERKRNDCFYILCEAHDCPTARRQSRPRVSITGSRLVITCRVRRLQAITDREHSCSVNAI
ncbi:unnamed protein product, partial [Staurois parvus]